MKNSIVNTRFHGLIDYILGFGLLTPWISTFHTSGTDTLVLGATGIFILTYSFLTDYEFGLIKLFSFRLHLVLDAISGAFLLVAPVFITMPNIIALWPVSTGLMMIVLAVLTPSRAYRITRRDLDITRP